MGQESLVTVCLLTILPVILRNIHVLGLDALTHAKDKLALLIRTASVTEYVEFLNDKI